LAQLRAISIQNTILEQDGAGFRNWRSLAQLAQHLHPCFREADVFGL